jgi:hypothetical protein
MLHHQHQNNQSNLSEGLRSGDLQGFILEKFTIDQFKSKMGADDEVIVVAFKVKEKYPAVDAVEFIEKNYTFVLDADMSTGEESDGKYSLFVEFERNNKFPYHLEQMLDGLSKLCDSETWKFKYFKDAESHTVSTEALEQFVPLTAEEYRLRVKEQKINDVSEILNQGPTEIIDVDESNNFTIGKPFGGNLVLNVESIGFYDEIIDTLPGAIQLDEASNGEILFLEKYLGNYEIHKIDNRFIIRNGDKAIIVKRRE